MTTAEMTQQQTTAEIAKRLVELCRQAEYRKAIDSLYAPDIVSVEAADLPNMPRQMRGLAAVRKKMDWWTANTVVHSATITGPFTAVDKFAVLFDFDVTTKPTGKRQRMAEVGFYTVAHGKIVHEEFLNQGTCASSSQGQGSASCAGE